MSVAHGIPSLDYERNEAAYQRLHTHPMFLPVVILNSLPSLSGVCRGDGADNTLLFRSPYETSKSNQRYRASSCSRFMIIRKNPDRVSRVHVQCISPETIKYVQPRQWTSSMTKAIKVHLNTYFYINSAMSNWEVLCKSRTNHGPVERREPSNPGKLFKQCSKAVVNQRSNF